MTSLQQMPSSDVIDPGYYLQVVHRVLWEINRLLTTSVLPADEAMILIRDWIADWKTGSPNKSQNKLQIEPGVNI